MCFNHLSTRLYYQMVRQVNWKLFWAPVSLSWQVQWPHSNPAQWWSNVVHWYAKGHCSRSSKCWPRTLFFCSISLLCRWDWLQQVHRSAYLGSECKQLRSYHGLRLCKCLAWATAQRFSCSWAWECLKLTIHCDRLVSVCLLALQCLGPHR